ncbi:hypothetical protein PQJ75_17955 [Rhodoplanes sp. TEM]|uniref:Uncharacterized protein n=1 Tax=Rhodoplanes tepidamans TaxID=200616 RepID=A0ABT5JGT9_RHOTP|nr:MULTISPECIES: hypothetical protein [Rhodoplanes]MDC7788911.1 hypothetical protein [Rhodoplanes tepidamans]MDC7985618.1 hypothetical protein [Rhodoplanes sp. TEM]MDQ0358753.1 hypothetical protein [Rhodoplanes tepidamans]
MSAEKTSKTFTSQKDPPEGSREVIDRELARQERQAKDAPQTPGAGTDGGDTAASGDANRTR